MFLLITLHVIVSVLLIVIVLLQVGKGAELGAAFGGTGQSQMARSGTTFVGKLTTGFAVTFMLTSLTLAWLSSVSSDKSVTETEENTTTQTEETTPSIPPLLPTETNKESATPTSEENPSNPE